jgi:hypothetical protein
MLMFVVVDVRETTRHTFLSSVRMYAGEPPNVCGGATKRTLYSVNSTQMYTQKYQTPVTFWIDRWVIPRHTRQPLDRYVIVRRCTPLGSDIHCFLAL